MLTNYFLWLFRASVMSGTPSIQTHTFQMMKAMMGQLWHWKGRECKYIRKTHLYKKIAFLP